MTQQPGRGLPPGARPSPQAGARPGGRARATVYVVIGAGLVVVVSFIVFLFVHGISHVPRPQRESLDQKRGEMARAFRGQGSTQVGAADLAAVRQLLQDWRRALRRKDESSMHACWDADRLFREVKRAAGTRFVVRPGAEAGHADAMVRGFCGGFADTTGHLSLQRLEICSARWLTPGREAVFYVREWYAEGHGGRFRYWAARRNGTWRLYDMEALEGGYRISIGAAAGMTGTPAQCRKRTADTQRLTEAARMALGGDARQAEPILKALASADLHPSLHALRLLALGQCKLSRGLADEALKIYDEAEAVHQDTPFLTKVRAAAYLQLEDWQKAAEHAAAFQKLLGNDAEARSIAGAAYARLGQTQRAQQEHLAGLTDDPHSQDNLIGLAQALSVNRKEPLRTRLQRATDPKAILPAVAEALIADGDAAGLGIVIDVFRSALPDYPQLPALQGTLRQLEQLATTQRAAATQTRPS